MRYEIRVHGHLDDDWSAWFAGLTIANLAAGEAVLAVDLPDQAALHGLLNQIRDLGLPLLAVNRIDDETEGGPRPGAVPPTTGNA